MLRTRPFPTPAGLVSEIRDLIEARAPALVSSTKGALWWLERLARSDTAIHHSAPFWILNAQLGTLDKLKVLFAGDGGYGTFELLGTTRNLFENLIWLRLFNRDIRWGIAFYRQLLDQQKQTTSNMIRKLRAEAALFEECDRTDSAILDDTLIKAVQEKATDEQIKAAQERHQAEVAELDMRVRRSFALYGAAAAVNSYLYQAHLLRQKIIPEHETSLAQIEASLAALEPELAGLLGDDRFLDLTQGRWSWKQRAEEVGMAPQYDFLYTYTSKLLHATPLNLITEKSLSESEVLTMLEYCFTAVSDLFDAIKGFSFEGRANMFMIEIDDPEEA